MTRVDFTPGKVVGSGAYGTVFCVQFKDAALEQRVNKDARKAGNYALKEMLMTRFIAEGRIKEVFIERCILASLDHPSIIKFYQSFKHQNKIYLLSEYCSRGSLHDFLQKRSTFNTNLARHITAEIVVAL